MQQLRETPPGTPGLSGVPYKHYASEVISGVLDGIVTPEDDDSADYPFIICHKMGMPPISIIGLGLYSDSSEIRVPKPPASNTTFMSMPLFSF